MIDDDTLTLYFYKETLTDEQRLAVETALASDAQLAQSYTALCRDLEQLQDTAAVLAPAHLKAQWHDVIDRAAQLERGKSPPVKPRWFALAWGGAIAAGLVVAFMIGTQFNTMPDEPGPQSAQVNTSTADTVPAAFTRGLQVHLQNATWDINQLGERSMDEQAALIQQIVAQNRMFERAAEARNAPDVARFMRALEPVLLQLSENNLTPVEADTLRMQLSFELNAVLTKIEHKTSELADII